MKAMDRSERLYERRERRFRPVLRRMIDTVGIWWVIGAAVSIAANKRERLRAANPQDPGLGRLEIEQILAEELATLIETRNYALPLPKKRKR